MNNPDIEVDASALLAIIREENPMVYELALRRAIIERQREVIATLHGATRNGQEVLA